MSCEHDCTRPPEFPKRIENRRALDTIDYRIGDYGSMLAHILSQIDAAPELAQWTHRKADDPGIALAESAAIVGDILAFYQHIYANEAYLRTSKWRESVSDLVRVLGYRLAPGLGGVARFALSVKGERPVRIPAGFAITAELPSGPKPATFETSKELQAVPALSKFHLYRPRHVPQIANGADTFQLDSGNDIGLAAGDRILVGVGERDTLSAWQILVVDEVRESFGVREVKTRGKMAFLGDGRRGNDTPRSAGELRAYKIVSSARHLGHNAPATRVVIGSNGHASEEDVSSLRRLDATQSDPASPALSPLVLPLEGDGADFAAGTLVLVETGIWAQVGSGARYSKALLPRRASERSIVASRRQTCGWGSIAADVALLQLDGPIATDDRYDMIYGDVRGITAHAVEGSRFRLRAASLPGLVREGNALDYYGRREDASALDQRPLLLGLPGGPVAANATSVSLGLMRGGTAFYRVMLDRPVDYAHFPHDAPKVEVYGNLAEATEGKTEAEAAIGDGDARAVFQTFPLPKAPLTYLLDTAAASPRLPQLEIWVERVKWTRVPTLFGVGACETAYIVREGDDGRSFVQFGDGRTGSRLPSGRGNVVARYRTGSGAHGMIAPDKKPSATRKVPGFEEVWMLGPATIGCVPESAASAQAAAPTTMQSLGRIVSLADYESEALALPGVLKARGAWTSSEGLFEITVTILTASGTADDAAAIDLALRRALAARGPSRCALRVRAGVRRSIQVRLVVAYDEARRTEDIATAIAAALGVEDDDPADDVDPGRRGLMHWRMRNFGDGVHGSQVLAAAQNVPGVAWVRLDQLRLVPAPARAIPAFRIPLLVATAARPAAAPERTNVRAMPQEMLSLARRDLSIDFVAVSARDVRR